jgi:hypothetical protein
VPRGTEHIDDMTPESPGGAGHDDLRLLHNCLPVVLRAAVLNAHKMPASPSV